MKLIELCKHPLKVRLSIPMKDHVCRQTYRYYREIIKNIKSNPNLRNLNLQQVTNLYPAAIEDGYVEYIVEVDDVEKESIYLSWKGEDYFLESIPNSFMHVFGTEFLGNDFRNNHYSFLGF